MSGGVFDKDFPAEFYNLFEAFAVYEFGFYLRHGLALSKKRVRECGVLH